MQTNASCSGSAAARPVEFLASIGGTGRSSCPGPPWPDCWWLCWSDRSSPARFLFASRCSKRPCEDTVKRLYEMIHRVGTMNFMQPNSAQSSPARATQVHPPISNQTRLAKFTALILVAILSLLCTLAWVAFLAWITWSWI
jgi:hypothetical protein